MVLIGGIDVVFINIIGIIPSSYNFIFYWFDISLSFEGIQWGDEPHIVILKFHESFLEIKNR